MNKIKLKDMQYQIKGVDTPKLLKECLWAVFLMSLLPLVISIIIYFADKIDSIDNFFQALFVVVLVVVLVMVKLWKMK